MWEAASYILWLYLAKHRTCKVFTRHRWNLFLFFLSSQNVFLDETLKCSRGYVQMLNTNSSVDLFLSGSSHVGRRGHRCGRPGSGGVFDFLHFQKMLWEEEEAEDGEREEGRPPQKGKGRRGRDRGEGKWWFRWPASAPFELVWVLMASWHWGFMFQEGEMKKEGTEEEKEQEKLGKLEFSLDYNFTEAQVRAQII